MLGLVQLADGRTDTGDSRNVPKGLGQDEAPRHGTGGTGVTWLQSKAPIRGGLFLGASSIPIPVPIPPAKLGVNFEGGFGELLALGIVIPSCQALPPDSCPRQAAGG